MTSSRVRRLAGLAVTAALCIGVFLHFFVYTEERLTLGSPYTVQAVLPDAGGMTLNSDVRQAGLPVGKVKDIALRNGNAVALLELDDRHAPIYRDATVLLRDKTPVGERYIELQPGRPSAGQVPSGGVLPLRQTRESVAIDEVLSTFDPATRRRLRRTLRGLGAGLHRHGRDLNRLYEASAALVEQGGPALGVLHAERGRVAALVDDLGRVMRTVGERARDVRALAARSKIAAESVAVRDAQLGQAFAQLPGAVGQVRRTSARLARFSGLATPVLSELQAAFEQLTPAVRELGPAAAAGRRTVRELGRFAPRATPLMADLERFSGKAARLMGPLDRFLDQFRPFVDYLAPYAGDFGAFFAVNRATSEQVIDPGKVVRLLFVVSEDTYAATRGEERKAYDALIETGLLSKTRQLGINPYPPPGSLGDLRPFSGRYPRVEADR